jgi:4-amino-4-deoxy-L-arabinose transferase-like glycosyltransferase
MAPPWNQTKSSPASDRGFLAILLLTVAGAILRLWGLGQLGLNHFDEGIYAISGLWAISPRSLAGLDPTVISYAPGGFPFLVGLAYLGFGVSDVAAIMPSIMAGTLTIPAAGWLARRTFGPGAGALAAAMAAISGFHAAYSRMALTDASFLFCWLLALIAGQRFLERPGLPRALVLGAAVGLAQWFKYNGWLAGVVVIFAAGLGMVVDPRERQPARLRIVWGAGLIAVATAAAIYWPWFAFVENHGGYSALLRHHRSYIGGPSTWFDHLRLQLEQATALSGGLSWNLTAAIAACLAAGYVRAPRPISARSSARLLLPLLLIAAVSVAPALPWWLGIPWLLYRWDTDRAGERLLLVAWAGLSILTPFYHPYARLWMPLLAIGWVCVGGLLTWAMGRIPEGTGEPRGPCLPSSRWRRTATWLCLSLGLLQGIALLRVSSSGASLPGPLSPSGGRSLRVAADALLKDLPAGVPGLRLLARPAVTFYLGRKVTVEVEPDLGHLVSDKAGGAWAVLDDVQLRQEGDLTVAAARLRERWDRVAEYPTALTLPTLLDVDPGAARSGRSEMVNASLMLLRPKTRGNAP